MSGIKINRNLWKLAVEKHCEVNKMVYKNPKRGSQEYQEVKKIYAGFVWLSDSYAVANDPFALGWENDD